MLGEREAVLVTGRIKKRIFFVIFAVLFFLAVSSAACAQSQQNNGLSTSKTQDANSPGSGVTAAQDIEITDSAANITLEQLQTLKKSITDSQELSNEIKTKIDEIYNQAIVQLQQALEFEAKKQDYSQRRKNAPVDLEKAKEQLAEQAAFTPPEISTDITLTQAEQKLIEATLAVEQAKKNTATWENEPKRRAERRTKIPEESNNAKQRLEEIKGKLAAITLEGQNAELVRANRTLLMVQQRALEAQITANTEELLCYDARRDVLAANRDLAARQLAVAEKLAEFWQQKVNELRQKQAQVAQKDAIRAKEETKYAHPVIQEIAEKNVELAQKQALLVGKIQEASQYFNRIDGQLVAIEKDFQEVREKVQKAGKITNVMGVLLLAKRNELPDIKENRRQIRSRLSEITLAQLELIRYDKEWSELSNIEEQAQNVVGKIDPPLGEKERERIRAEVVNYLQNKRKILQAISDLYLDYSTALANLDAKESSFVQTVQEYEDFIDKNILWVKSSSTLSIKDTPDVITAVGWLVRPRHLQKIAEALGVDFRKKPLTYIAVIAFFTLLVVLHHKIHRLIENLSRKLHDVNIDSFMHTLKVFLLTLFLAATWPVVILFLRWRLLVDASVYDYTQAFAGGLQDLSIGIFIFELLRHMTMSNGLIQDHFRVGSDSLTFVRKHLRWFFILVIPLTFILRILQLQQTNDQMYNTLGRLVFITILVLLAIFLLVLLRPTGLMVGPYLKRRREGWAERLRYLWYPLCLILPIGISVLAAMGYFYAAWNLYEKLMGTLLLVFLVFVFKAMLTRWLIVTRRRLSLIEVQKRKATAQEEAVEAKSQTNSPESDVSKQVKAKPEKTIFEISQQADRLINAIITVLLTIGLWYVWRDVLPALGALEDIELWKTTGAQGSEIISLGSLVMASIIVIMTIVVARNVPGLLEIIILRRLPLDRGVRFAVITICRYILVIVGIVLAFTEIGIGWSKVQWLVAAMTVGLGFGLQEIFANFISGLIILFEQPVRMDDVVTIGDVTGTVTKIKIRATTIRKWDQRELVVPNKEFITGRLINWTLSDKVLRSDFVVGIAYGSDIAKAEKTLYEVAGANPLVLENPKPIVLFRGFGDSSLEFELRVYIAGIENYIPVWHGINCAIDDAFRKAGIEIAFPQHDLHIRSIKTNIPIDVNKIQQ
jgi:potassium efflux system protein